jgi:hypothetical protein
MDGARMLPIERRDIFPLQRIADAQKIPRVTRKDRNQVERNRRALGISDED